MAATRERATLTCVQGHELFELYWLRIPGVGARHLHALSHLIAGHSVEEAFRWIRSRLPDDLSEALAGFSPSTAWGGEALVAAQRDLQWLKENEVSILRRDDASFPQLLGEIHDPPPLMFVRGNLSALRSSQVAIVGSRRATQSGREMAASLAAELSGLDVATTSGLARGIDVAAHRGALRAGGVTVAVLGAGLGHVYPRENVAIAEEILERGCLVSEFPPGMTPRPEHFPRRNRIISGLSMGVVVVEAASRSGSLITARLALEQGREVFAVPGSVFNPLARGCHELLRQGARLLEGVDDLLEELPALGRRDTATDTAYVALALDGDEVRMLEAMGYDNVTADQLIDHTGMDSARAAVVLAGLELKGIVQMERGGYIRCPSASRRAGR